MHEVGKKYNYRTLYRMRKLYEVFGNEKLTTLLSKLTWSHYLLLLTLNDNNKIIYYINLAISQNFSVRQLEEKIKNKEYERLDENTRSKLIKQEENKVSDLIKNPILIKNSCNYTKISEKILKKLILEDIDNLRKDLFEIDGYHTEGGKEQKNWHVLTLRKTNNYNY